MNTFKIKRHFSLFMVKKSIKKRSSESNVKHILQDEKHFHSQQIQKFIDPIQCYHFGDIYFIDKLYDQDVGLISINNYFKSITNLEYNAEHECWEASIVTFNYSLGSWNLVYDRLMSLGDQKAYDLAQTIDSIYISKKKLKKIEDRDRPKLNNKENGYLEEVETMFQLKEKSIYLSCKYQISKTEKSLEIKKIGFSKKLIELAFGNEHAFIDHLLNYGFFDFLTIEAENYFTSINDKLNCVVNAKKYCGMELKFQTIDGYSSHVMPIITRKIQLNENAEVTELIIVMELKLKENFIKLLESKREEKTKYKKKKTNREIDLENLLNFYYNNDEFKKNPSNFLDENLKAIKNEEKYNICGYRIINKFN